MSDESLKEIAEIMTSNEGFGGGRESSCSSSTPDWGCSFDDNDSAYWETYMGGPDDVDIDAYYDNFEQDDYFEYEETEEAAVDNEDANDDEGTTLHVNAERQKDIVNWLSTSKLARRFKNREGFFVPRGPHVKLKDGEIVDLLDWLFEEGIKGGIAVAGYSVIYNKPGTKFGETLSFFKIVVEAPFARSGNDKNEKNSAFDDDIPF